MHKANSCLGVSVTVRGEVAGTSTNEKGYYSIRVAKRMHLSSFLYRDGNTNIASGWKTSIMVTLQSANSSLNDVAVICTTATPMDIRPKRSRTTRTFLTKAVTQRHMPSVQGLIGL